MTAGVAERRVAGHVERIAPTARFETRTTDRRLHTARGRAVGSEIRGAAAAHGATDVFAGARDPGRWSTRSSTGTRACTAT